MLQFAIQLFVVVLSTISVAETLKGVYEESDAAYEISYGETERNRHEHALMSTHSGKGGLYRDEVDFVTLLMMVDVEVSRHHRQYQVHQAEHSNQMGL